MATSSRAVWTPASWNVPGSPDLENADRHGALETCATVPHADGMPQADARFVAHPGTPVRVCHIRPVHASLPRRRPAAARASVRLLAADEHPVVAEYAVGVQRQRSGRPAGPGSRGSAGLGLCGLRRRGTRPRPQPAGAAVLVGPVSRDPGLRNLGTRIRPCRRRWPTWPTCCKSAAA